MRYYSLTISDPNTGQSIVQDGKGGFTRGSGPTFTSLAKNPFTGRMSPDPGALDITIDVPVIPMATPQGNPLIKVFGVGLRMISQAANLSGMNFALKAGMSYGLPLANTSPPPGLIAQGKVLTSYGNWQGVNQTLDLVITPGPIAKFSAANAGNINFQFDIPVIFNWAAGTTLNSALSQVFNAVFPNFKQQISITTDIVLTNDESGYYENINQFAAYLKGLTISVGSQIVSGYRGVDIFFSGDTIVAQEDAPGTVGSALPKKLLFSDLVGQPTWITPATIQFSTVLRADLDLTSYIIFPQGVLPPYAQISDAAGVQSLPGTPAASRIAFGGTWKLTEIHHFGQFRQPSADAWVTTFVGAPSTLSG